MIKHLLHTYLTTIKGLLTLNAKVLYYHFSIFLGSGITLWFLYNRFIRLRLPKDIPLELTEIWFYILVYICLIYLYIVISLLFPRKENPFIKKLVDMLYLPLTNFDTAWKTSEFIQPYYMTIMSNLISYLNSKDDMFKHLIFIIFQIFPRIILIIVFSIDIFWFKKLFYIYKVILLGSLPLLHRYIKYSLKIYTDHLIIFGTRDYECISINNSVRILMGEEPNPDAIYDEYKATMEKYIDIISENITNIRNNVYQFISLDNNYKMKIAEDKLFMDCDSEDYIPYLGIKYTGIGREKNSFIRKYAKRFFNKEYINNKQELTENELFEMSNEFRRHYIKIFMLKDIIPLYDNIINKPVYRYVRAFIFSIYFFLWGYLIIKSYHNIPDFNITKVLLEWLELYIPEKDPFSDTTLNEKMFTIRENNKEKESP